MNLLEASSRVALAGLLTGIGMIKERAGHDLAPSTAEQRKKRYCPFKRETGKPTHLHPAYAPEAWDQLIKIGPFPNLSTNCAPFEPYTGTDIADTLIDVSSSYHVGQTFLQKIIATAYMVASGMCKQNFQNNYQNQKEPDNRQSVRLSTLFEKIKVSTRFEKKQVDPKKNASPRYQYLLRPMTANEADLYPKPVNGHDGLDQQSASREYEQLWDYLLDGLSKIPQPHVNNLPLWLDHFDSLWMTAATSIPALILEDVERETSLYDQSKVTAAIATALWRWHHANPSEQTPEKVSEDFKKPKFLLIQGDFFGIQDFIFAEGGQTQKHSHKLLRGRSFQVGLLGECAALNLLEKLELPSTSQIINTAGKFLIIAPNTIEAKEAVERCRSDLNKWCLEHTFGDIGVGLATTEASCEDFASKHFSELNSRLFEALEDVKFRRFDLCSNGAPTSFNNFFETFERNQKGVCEINGRYPADQTSKDGDYNISNLAADQILIGEKLPKPYHILITQNTQANGHGLERLALSYFGYSVYIVQPSTDLALVNQFVQNSQLKRYWDFVSPDCDGRIWQGYAKRFVNAHVPVWTVDDPKHKDKRKYGQSVQDEEPKVGAIKTLEEIAAEDRYQLKDSDQYQGKIALVTLKGDIDNLGAIFQGGVPRITATKMIALSRQINMFFSVWLPWYCEHGKDTQGQNRYRNTYTVFAGGDDFFLLGPWESTFALATELRKKFSEYVVNECITFSAGLLMTKPNTPIRFLRRAAEEALDDAKSFEIKKNSLTGLGDESGSRKKNAVSIWGQKIAWVDWHKLMGNRLDELADLVRGQHSVGNELSTRLTHSLLDLTERAASNRPEDAIWRSQLHYKLARYFERNGLGSGERANRKATSLEDAIKQIGGALDEHRGAYRIPVSVLLYKIRD